MPGPRLPPEVRREFFTALQGGYSVAAASKKVGISLQTAYKWANGQTTEGHNWKATSLERQLPLPKRKVEGDAKDALTNFELFRRRYLGRRSTPWQLEAAELTVKWLRSPETEFTVINCPPGSGKSTLFTHDIPAWLVVRNRNIRIMIGSSNLRMASKYSGRIRRTLERPRPVEGATACLAMDYGRFKPEIQDIWRMEEFVVLPFDNEPIEDKEPTVSAFGMESEFLGTRANFVVWDDLVTNKTMATAEKIEKLQQWWETEGETRLEPGGLLLLQGQRMGPEDLYNYALTQQVAEDYDNDDDDHSDTTRYNHIIFPAHFEDRCHEEHTRDAPPYPKGCLLDPIRLPWRGKNGLATIQQNKEAKYRVQYQQEDVDPESVLVKKVWVDGGRDSDGVVYHGCWDNNRDIAQVPANLELPLYSIATADPSPTKYWSVQWWIYQPSTNQRFLIDMVRHTMDAPDFLDWVQGSGVYVGVMNDWQIRSREMGFPITHWIVENNAAQTFLLQYDFVKRWQRMHKVNIIPHTTTGARKLNDDFGIQMLKNVWKHGLCRLPGLGRGKVMAMPLVTEGTRYPAGTTDDCLMAQWFLEFWLPQISRPATTSQKLVRPSWAKRIA